MIGRGALGNPFIFREAVSLIENGCPLAPASLKERLDVALKHLDLACLFKGEIQGIREMRKHLSWYTRGMRGAARIRESLNHATTREQVTTLLEQIQ
jgi:tRNA-dihydrouridine synthase